MSSFAENCRMEKWTSRPNRADAHNHEIPGSNPGPATSIACGTDSRLTAGDQPGGARLPRRAVSSLESGCNPHPAPRPDIFQIQPGYSIQIAGGASSSRPAGDDCRGATGNPGAMQPPPASRPDPVFCPHAVAAKGGCAPDGARDDSRRAVALAAGGRGAAPVSIHVSADTASLLALLAAERGETLADAVAWLVVDEISRKGGIAHV